VLLALLLASVASFALALAAGSVPGVLSALVDSSLVPDRDRRALAAAAAARAVGVRRRRPARAGRGLLQALLRNPLADAYVLGVSGGRRGRRRCWLCLPAPGCSACQVGSALGAFATLAALFLLARRVFFGRLSSAARVAEEASTGVLLTGVMLAAFSAALLSLLLALAPDVQMRLDHVLAAGRPGRRHRHARGAWRRSSCSRCCWRRRRRRRGADLPAAGGDLQAFVQVSTCGACAGGLVLVSALATATAVTLAGAIGFVGFVAPHLMRQLVGNDQRALLPAAVLAGAVLVLLADTVARTAVAPLQLPSACSRADRCAGVHQPREAAMSEAPIEVPGRVASRRRQGCWSMHWICGCNPAAAGWCWARTAAGKSTLLATLAGARRADDGVVLLDGHRLEQWDVQTLAAQRSLLPDGWLDPFAATVLDTVLTARYRSARRTSTAPALPAHWLARFDCDGLLQRDVRSLSRAKGSGGDRHRVVAEAPLLLLDEPIAHQDRATRHCVDGLRASPTTRWCLAARPKCRGRLATHALPANGRGDWTADRPRGY